MRKMEVFGKEVRVDGRLVRIGHLDGDKYMFAENIEETLAALRASKERIDLFTFLQKPPDVTPRYAYPMELDNLAVMPISTYEHWWNHQIKSLARNRARQAEKKGLSVREVPFDDRLIEGIVAIHNETPIRQGRRFPHFGMDWEGARNYAGTFRERSVFLGIFDQERMVGFVKLVIDDSSRYACVIHNLSLIQYRDRAPSNALMAQAVKSCVARGLSHLVYEQFRYGKKDADGLSAFKETVGFRPMELPRYYVPLTSLGWLALKLRLHHSWVEHVPEPLLARYRALRSTWHAATHVRPPDHSASRSSAGG